MGVAVKELDDGRTYRWVIVIETEDETTVYGIFDDDEVAAEIAVDLPEAQSDDPGTSVLVLPIETLIR